MARQSDCHQRCIVRGGDPVDANESVEQERNPLEQLELEVNEAHVQYHSGDFQGSLQGKT